MVDSFFAIVRRTVKRADPSARDREHLHHRLMRLGHGQRRSVVILWAWTAILSAFVLYPTFSNRGNHLIPLGSAALGVALYTLFHPGIRGRELPDDQVPDMPEDPELPRDLRLVDGTGETGQAHDAEPLSAP
jgi:UDP-GlcNAc:undecaprenyl-phosphate GlcNAc-1-phosphate transferase